MASMEATEDDMGISTRIQDFQKDLGSLSDDLVVQKHITSGDSFILDGDRYFLLKHEVSEHFNLHPSQVILVGSGKLGFSIAPNKKYRFFRDESDLDVAIVSVDLFDKMWWDVFEYWNEGGLWERHEEFKHYLFRGWLRPDYLPTSLQSSREWFEFFRKLTATGRYGPYKISAAIYQTWQHLENYQKRAVNGCRETLRLENENDSNQ